MSRLGGNGNFSAIWKRVPVEWRQPWTEGMWIKYAVLCARLRWAEAAPLAAGSALNETVDADPVGDWLRRSGLRVERNLRTPMGRS